MEVSDILLQKVKNDSLLRISKTGINASNLYIDSNPLAAGETICAGRQEIPIKKETIMVFVDDNPLRNWGHACRYFLYDAVTGKFSDSIDARFPPQLYNPPSTFSPFHQPVVFPVPSGTTYPIKPPDHKPMFPNYPGKRYAILFSGASNFRHINDLELVYRTLTWTYGFFPDNIFVLNYDGTLDYSDFYPVPKYQFYPDLPDKIYHVKIRYPGTSDALDNVFESVSQLLKNNDMLFIYTSNHGDGPSDQDVNAESALTLYSPNGEALDYSTSQLVSKLAQMPKFKQLYVVMAQCHSGGFMQPVLNNSAAEETCFIGACPANETSMGGIDHDPFAMYWATLMQGETGMPGNIDSPKSAEISFQETKNGDVRDTPVIGSNPEGAAQTMVLGNS